MEEKSWRSNPGGVILEGIRGQKHPGVIQEAPRRSPGSTQQVPRMLPEAPRGTQKAPRDTQEPARRPERSVK